MAAIVESIVGDRRLQLGNEEFVRQMLIGRTWTKLRIGMNVAINGTAAFNNGALTVGVCQGFTNTFRSTNTTDYVGVQVPQTPGTWTYFGSPNYYFNAGASCLGLKRTGNTTTTGSNGNVNTSLWPPVVSGYRTPCFIDIVRAASYTFTVYNSVSTSPLLWDETPGQFLSDAQNENAPVWSGSSNVGTGSVAYSGAAQHDCVSINWNLSTPSIEISNLVVVRFY